MLYCPKCKNCLDKKEYAAIEKTIINSSTSNIIKRIRRCGYCSNRFSTTEIITQSFNSLLHNSAKLRELEQKIRELK